MPGQNFALKAQSALANDSTTAAGVRQAEDMLTLYAAAKAVRANPGLDNESDAAHTAYGPLNCWSFDDDPPVAGYEDYFLPNTFWFVPHSYPTARRLIEVPRVCRFLFVNSVSTPRLFGWDGLSFFGYTNPLDDFSYVRPIKWLITVPRQVETELSGTGVLLASHQAAAPLHQQYDDDDIRAGHRFLRQLYPPTSIGSDDFLASDVLNIVIVSSSLYFASLYFFAGFVNEIEWPLDGFGTFYVFPGTSWNGAYVSATGTLTSRYTEDRARVVAAHSRFPGHRTVIYLDHERSGQTEANADDQDSLTDAMETGLVSITADLAAYNFSYGGRISFLDTDYTHFMSLIESHFGL